MGRKIQILLDGADWQRAVIAECRIEWVESGLVAQPWHKVTPVTEAERKVKGSASVLVELSKKRWYERRAVAAKVKDAAAEARWKANEERRVWLLGERGREGARQEEKLKRREQYVRVLQRKHAQRRDEAMGCVRFRFDDSMIR